MVRVEFKVKCDILVLCSKVGHKHAYAIKTLVSTHTCDRVLNNRSANSMWVAKAVVKKFLVNVRPEFPQISHYHFTIIAIYWNIWIFIPTVNLIKFIIPDKQVTTFHTLRITDIIWMSLIQRKMKEKIKNLLPQHFDISGIFYYDFRLCLRFTSSLFDHIHI